MKQQVFITSIVFVVLVGIIVFLFWYFTPGNLSAYIAGLMPSVVLWYSQIRKEKSEHHDWLLRNKEACLAEIVDIFISQLQDKESSERAKNAKLLERIKYLQSGLFVWGSPTILHAWNEMQETSVEGISVEEATRRGEKLFRIIRKELGHDDSSLKPGGLWATMLKPEEKEMAFEACRGEVYE